MKASIISRIAAASAAGGDALQRLSLPKSSEFVSNSRGQRLHVRTQLAKSEVSDQGPRGVIVFLHGLHAHGSRITSSTLAAEINTLGYHFAALDFHGHGHSDGQPGVITSHLDLIDDASSLLSVLYRDPSAAPAAAHRVDTPPLDPTSCPFYLMGSSMGGAVALLLAHTCCSRAGQAQPDRYSSACRGAILAAPALQIKLPWFVQPSFILSPVTAALRWIVLPLAPSLALLQSPTQASALQHPIWDTDEYIAYICADAATFHGRLHIVTLCSIIDLSRAVTSAIPSLDHSNFRVLALMDPADAVTDFAGVLALHASPIAAAGQVTVLELPGAKHDVLTNRADAAMQSIAAWLPSAVSARRSSAALGSAASQ